HHEGHPSGNIHLALFPSHLICTLFPYTTLFRSPSFFYLDDVCVSLSGGGGTPSPTPTGSPTCTPGGSGPLWYNGDFNGVNGLAKEENTTRGNCGYDQVYYDFNVIDSRWTVTSVF